jgi:hypothetical protein
LCFLLIERSLYADRLQAKGVHELEEFPLQAINALLISEVLSQLGARQYGFFRLASNMEAAFKVGAAQKGNIIGCLRIV